MATPPLSRAVLEQALAVLAEHGGNQTKAAEALGIARHTLQNRLRLARQPEAPKSEWRKPTIKEEPTLAEQYGEPPPPAFIQGPCVEYISRPDNTFLFGAIGDNHAGSKYERLDVLDDLYQRFAQAGADRVFHTGNWIDGECRFNTHELHTHGLDAQIRHLVDVWPQVGLTTYAVHGDDHEGWYGKREGVDVGRYCEHRFRDHGREDWVDLGFMEAYVRLVNANTGAAAVMSVVHPGGGSAYALSYAIQKIIESLEGGEKPAVGLYGHYHKLWSGLIRNVWCIQTGCGQDQTTFMRKKRLEAHVGGMLVELEQDPETGAILGCTPKMLRYFNQGYYQNRWSMAGPAVLPPRTIGGWKIKPKAR